MVILEPDGVGEPAIAEDDGRHSLARQRVRLIESVRVNQAGRVIAREVNSGGAREDLLIRRDPADAVLAQQRQNVHAHGAFGRPHAAGLPAEARAR